MNQDFSTALIRAVEALSGNVLKISLETPFPFDFTPGQFVTISTPAFLEQGIERSYSIASEPGSELLELCVSLKPDGLFTPTLFTMKSGDSLLTTAPKGDFIPPGDLDVPLCLICTGTGVAPFRAIIRKYILQNTLSHDLILIAGNRTVQDALFHHEFAAYASRFERFSYYPVLSRENKTGFATGYVHAVYESIFADGRDARFMVCGWTPMLKEARQRLKALGYNRKQYLFESYDG